MTTTITRQDCLVLPYVATTEAKAEMFADALEEVFLHDITAEVFADGEKWGVAVTEGMAGISDPLNDERIVSVVILLAQYDLIDGDGDLDCLAEGTPSKIPAALGMLTKRARRSFRIEDKLDAILTALVGTEGAKAIECSASESRRPELATV